MLSAANPSTSARAAKRPRSEDAEDGTDYSQSGDRLTRARDLQKELPNEIITRYDAALKKHRKSTFDDRLHPSTKWLTRPHATPGSETHYEQIDNEVRVAPSSWTLEEQSLFFAALSRRSKHFPDLIAEDLGRTKTSTQVAQYINLLEAAARRDDQARRRATVPRAAARELPAEWIRREEKLAAALPRCDEPAKELPLTADPFWITASWTDEQVANAAVFARYHQRMSQCGELVSLQHEHSADESERSESHARVTAYKFKDILRTIACHRTDETSVRGQATSSYQSFAELHPVPDIPRPAKLTLGAQPGRRRLWRGSNKRTKTGHPSESESRSYLTERSMGERLVLRMCEIGLLHRIESIPPTDSSHQEGRLYRLGAVKRSRGQGKRRHSQFKLGSMSITSWQDGIIPTGALSGEMLVWSQDLEETQLGHGRSQRMAKTARSLMGKAAVECLDRLLHSTTADELIWLSVDKSAAGEDSRPAAPRHTPVPTASESPTKASKSRLSTLEPFAHLLQGLEPTEKKRVENRLRKRIKLWGMAETLAVGAGPVNKNSTEEDAGDELDEEDELADIEVSAGPRVEKASTHPGASKTLECNGGPTTADRTEQQALPLTAASTEPTLLPTQDRVEVGGRRFASIGFSRSQALVRLYQLSSALLGEKADFTIIDLKSLGKMMKAMSQETLLLSGQTQSRSVSSGEQMQCDLIDTLAAVFEHLFAFLQDVVDRIIVGMDWLVYMQRKTILDAPRVREALRSLHLPLNIAELDSGPARGEEEIRRDFHEWTVTDRWDELPEPSNVAESSNEDGEEVFDSLLDAAEVSHVRQCFNSITPKLAGSMRSIHRPSDQDFDDVEPDMSSASITDDESGLNARSHVLSGFFIPPRRTNRPRSSGSRRRKVDRYGYKPELSDVAEESSDEDHMDLDDYVDPEEEDEDEALAERDEPVRSESASGDDFDTRTATEFWRSSFERYPSEDGPDVDILHKKPLRGYKSDDEVNEETVRDDHSDADCSDSSSIDWWCSLDEADRAADKKYEREQWSKWFGERGSAWGEEGDEDDDDDGGGGDDADTHDLDDEDEDDESDSEGYET